MKRLRFKYFMPERNEFSSSGEENLLSVSEYYGVKPRIDAFEGEAGESRADSLEGYRIVHQGDFVMNYMLAWKGAYGVSDHNGIVSPAYAVYKVDTRIANRRFIHHRLRSEHMRSAFRTRSKGIIESRLRLYPETFLGMEITLPDLETQKAIADFLDRETARIDQLIEKKGRLRDKTESEFIDIITFLSISGLDLNLTKKASGYAWHPEISAHWEATRLKFLCSRIVDCLHETPEHDEEGEYPSIRTADVERGKLKLETAKRVSAAQYRHRIQRLEPEEDDVVYTREGERFGLAALVPASVRICLGQRMMMFRTNARVLPAYLMWSLNGQFAYNYLKQGTAGATSPHLNIFDIRNVPIFLPPLEEQAQICEKIDAHFRAKEHLLDLIDRTSDRLREFRSALITAAVTGRIDVSDWRKQGRVERRLDDLET